MLIQIRQGMVCYTAAGKEMAVVIDAGQAHAQTEDNHWNLI